MKLPAHGNTSVTHGQKTQLCLWRNLQMLR